MAKSIRSKSKRKNRTQLRKTLTEPKTRQRQEKIAAAIKQAQAEKSGSSIMALQKALAPKPPIDPAIEDGDGVISADEKEETVQKIPKKYDALKPRVYKGSRPKHNPGKELVWFK